MKKIIVILLVFLFGIFMFTACGGDVPEPETKPPEETTTAPEAKPDAADELIDSIEPEDTDEPTHFSEVTGPVDAGWIKFTLQGDWFIEDLRIFDSGWKESEGWFDEEDDVRFKIKRRGQGGSIEFQFPFPYNSDSVLESAEKIAENWELDPPEEVTINGVKYLVVNNDDTLLWLLTTTGGFDLDSKDYFSIDLSFMSLEQAMPFLETVSVP